MILVGGGVIDELSKHFLPNSPKKVLSPSHLKILATPLTDTLLTISND
jgi:hypothetical protein